MRKALYRSLILIFGSTLLLSSITKTNAVSIPSPTVDFYVYDEVGVLSSSTIETILSVSNDLQRKTKAQLVVVIMNSFHGETIESTGLAILRGWKIGDAQLDNGVLILVSITDRRSRIEVGYGLEGALNDAKTGRIQDTFMAPYFSQDDFDTGIQKGYLALANEIAKEYNITIDPNADPPSTNSNLFSDLPSWIVIGMIFLVLLFLAGLDLRFTNGIFLRLLFQILFSIAGSSGSGRSFGGGGSGGGGGSSRKW
jgi:uncharacterized protein